MIERTCSSSKTSPNSPDGSSYLGGQSAGTSPCTLEYNRQNSRHHFRECKLFYRYLLLDIVVCHARGSWHKHTLYPVASYILASPDMCGISTADRHRHGMFLCRVGWQRFGEVDEVSRRRGRLINSCCQSTKRNKLSTSN